jgi:hypothetical protein
MFTNEIFYSVMTEIQNIKNPGVNSDLSMDFKNLNEQNPQTKSLKP